MNYVYTHDKMGNVATKATDHGDYGYGYDDLYRLTDVDNPAQADEAFTYDDVGNRLTSNDTSSEWAYNEDNELDGHDDVTYDYDLNGNMIQKTVAGVVTKFFYNVEDRLERVEDGPGHVIASYYYDPFGRRLWKDVSGARTHFHYSDEGLVGEYDAVGGVIKTYGYKPGSTWSTDPLFMKVGSKYYFYHNDHLGTPQKMTAVNGAVVWSAMYSSFGEASVVVEAATSNFRFAGQYYDEETGLHYNYHRYYDPRTGRYLTPDPIGLAGMDPNLYGYVYVLNNPVNLIDPLGLIWETTRYNYHGTTNWLRGILKYAGELIGAGQIVAPGSDSFSGAERTTIQTWVSDPNNPERNSEYPIGSKRLFDQTYMKKMTGPNDLTNDPFYYYQWSPYVSEKTYEPVPGGAKYSDPNLSITNDGCD